MTCLDTLRTYLDSTAKHTHTYTHTHTHTHKCTLATKHSMRGCPYVPICMLMLCPRPRGQPLTRSRFNSASLATSTRGGPGTTTPSTAAAACAALAAARLPAGDPVLTDASVGMPPCISLSTHCRTGPWVRRVSASKTGPCTHTHTHTHTHTTQFPGPAEFCVIRCTPVCTFARRVCLCLCMCVCVCAVGLHTVPVVSLPWQCVLCGPVLRPTHATPAPDPHDVLWAH